MPGATGAASPSRSSQHQSVGVVWGGGCSDGSGVCHGGCDVDVGGGGGGGGGGCCMVSGHLTAW